MEIKIKEQRKPIGSPKDVSKILVKVLKAENEIDRAKEHLWGVYLNSRNVIKRVELISLGIVDGNLVHPREFFKPAIEVSATGAIMVHNHPSGDVSPSEADIEISKRIVEAGKILGIDLLDHIIISEKGRYTSFKEKDLI
jgi:DNA repair protein RadC